MPERLTPIQQYAGLMSEVKRRTAVVDFFLSGRGNCLYKAATLETIGLQLRKILELVAFSSLIANEKAYASVHENYARHWKAKLLLENLARINPDFYPKPIVESPSQIPGIKSNLEPLRDGFLTEADFVLVHEKCGKLMHATNPFRAQLDFQFYEGVFPVWYKKVAALLNSHTIKLLDDPGFWLIHMKEPGDDEVHYYVFQPKPTLPS